MAELILAEAGRHGAAYVGELRRGVILDFAVAVDDAVNRCRYIGEGLHVGGKGVEVGVGRGAHVVAALLGKEIGNVGHGAERRAQAGQVGFRRPRARHAQGHQRGAAVVDIARWEAAVARNQGEHLGCLAQLAAHGGIVGAECHLVAAVNADGRRTQAGNLLAHAVEPDFML